MGLSARELLLIMRAKDEISGTLSAVGRNMGVLNTQSMGMFDAMRQGGMLLATTGAAVTTAGVAMASFLKNSVDAAAEYSREAALTLTQAQRTGASLEEIKRIGLAVGKDIPVAFEGIQGALYDIFSTIDVSVPQSETLLRAFATAAVAGQADIQSVSRLTMGVMNAYKMPIEDVNKVLDTQFRLVELGAGTYQEFVDTLGRNVPTAVAAGQSFETLSAAMAFLTRQGVPVANASAAVGRAFEMLSSPKAVRALQDLGVQVTDNNGKFLQFNEVITQLAQSKGWAEMTEPDRKVWFKEIFGTGTIQARRFFDVAIPNFETFNRMVDEMNNSAGAVQTAFGTMFGEPAMQAQLLANRWAAFRIEIGTKLIPVMLELVNAGTKVLAWWDNLSDSTKDMVVKFTAIATAVALIVGPFMMFVGALLMFVGVAAPLVGGLGALATIMLGLPAVILLAAGAIAFIMNKFDGLAELVGIKLVSMFVGLAAIILGSFVPVVGTVLGVVAGLITVGYLIYKHWDDIKAFLVDTWNAIQTAWDAFVSGFEGGNSKSGLLGAFEDIGRGIAAVWPTIQSILREMEDGFKKFWAALGELGSTAWSGFTSFVEWLWNVAGPQVIDTIQSMWDKITSFTGFLVDTFGNTIVSTVQSAIDKITEFGTAVGSTTLNAVTDFGNKTIEVFQSIWDKAQEVWGWFSTIFGPSWTEIWQTLQTESGNVASELTQTWNLFKDDFITAKDGINEAITAITNTLSDLKYEWDETVAVAKQVIDDLQTKLTEFKTFITEEFVQAWNDAKTALSEGWQSVLDAWNEFKDAAKPIIDELKLAWQDLKDTWTNEVVPAAQEAKDSILQAWQELKDTWVNEIWPQLRESWEELKTAWNELVTEVTRLLAELNLNWDIGWQTILGTTLAVMAAIVLAIIGGFVLILQQLTQILLVITQLIVTTIQVISNNIQLFLNILQGDWGAAWNNILNIVTSIWNLIYQVISSIINLIVNVIRVALSLIGIDFNSTMNMLASVAASGMIKVFNSINEGIQRVLGVFRSLPGMIQGIFSGAINWLVNAGSNIVQGLINGLNSRIPSLRSMATSIGSIVKSAVGSFLGIKSPSTVMYEMGEMTALGFELGLASRNGALSQLLNNTETFDPTGFAMPSVDTSYDPKGEEMIDLMRRLVSALEDPKSRGLHADTINIGNQDDIIELDDWSRRRFSGG